jgi:pimeloyl-ACP methyl ester carboxylesterase
MKKTFMYLTTLLLLLQACTQQLSTPATQPTTESPVSETEASVEDTASRLERLGGYPCPDSDFTCINVTVPLDHFDPQNTKTIDVVFAVLPATGERKGMFVTSIGGPGGSGLLSADGYTATFDPSIPESFDIVFFDQRGINESNGLYCAQAAADYYRADTDATTKEGEENLLDVTETFVDACIAEIGETDLLPYLDTTQAVEDLEAFRALMGDEKFWLYGESYGTQFAQTYATAHPDHIAGLILDGVVDLTLTDIEYLKEQATAFNDVLVATLQACNEDEACAADMGRDAVAVYDELAAQLKQGSISFDFPLSTGQVQQREFTLSLLESVAGYLYTESDRMVLLRALAAYSRDQTLVPLARVAYNALYLNPDNLEVYDDPSYSDAIYYGVTCRDYAEPGDTAEEQAENFIRAGDETDASLPRFSSMFYGDLPCVYWPYPEENDERSAPFTGEGFPTLVLNGTTDPATPYSNALSVYSHLSDGYLVTELGGPHVIFGWGVECIDGLVTAFLVEEQVPAERETVCEGVVADEFVPLAFVDAADYESPLEALAAVENEIAYLPEYYGMASTTARASACPYGGTLTFDYGDTGDVFTLTDCAFSRGFIMTGSGFTNYEEGSFTLEVEVTGLKDGSLTYIRDGEGSILVTGTYDGEEIEISE